MELFGGADVSSSEKTSVLLCGGFGYRYWSDELWDSRGYLRQIHWLYLPLQMDINGPVAQGTTIGGRLGLELLLGGFIQSSLSDADPTMDDATNVLPAFPGVGAGVSAYLKQSLGAGLSLRVEPYFHYWTVQESLPDYVNTGAGVAEVVEPANTTTEAGLVVSLCF